MAKINNPVSGFTFKWRDFFVYGFFWSLIFIAVIISWHIGNVYRDQQNQIQDLIERLKRYEEVAPYSETDPIDKEDHSEDFLNLSSWVKSNLPSRGVEERPAVALVFRNLADMLDEGSLQDEKDAFAEGISQLQPVASRSIWLGFLTKLTKKLQSAHLDSAGLSSAFRVIASAISPETNTASYLLLQGVMNELLEAGKKSVPSSDVEATKKETPSQPNREDKTPVESSSPRSGYGNWNYYNGYNWRYW